MKIIKLKGKCECWQCNREKNDYIDIYEMTICGHNFQLCTECIFTLSEMIKETCSRDLGYLEPTEEDKRIESKLRILLNRKLNNLWNDDCKAELESLPFEEMSSSNKLIYKTIIS